MVGFFNAFIYEPLYNGLIFLVTVVPFFDVGLAVILLTCIVKLALFPLSKKSVQTQMAMKAIEPDLAKIKEKFKNSKEEQARETLKLYRQYGVNPFSSFLVILIQIPIIFGLYYVFFKGGLPTIDTSILYSFTPIPSSVNMNFLGLTDISQKSLILAFLAGITQFFQARYSMPPIKPREADAKPSFQEDLARSMSVQMRYVFPVIVFFIAYSISGAIALYWATSNLFAIGQELVMRKKFKTKTIVQNNA